MEIAVPPNDRLSRAELLGRILVLHWTDGHRSELTLEGVRRACPCAVCAGERAAAGPQSALRVLPPAGNSAVQAIHAVGRYALQITWQDGHASGIYSFDLLRQLCDCPGCAG